MSFEKKEQENILEKFGKQYQIFVLMLSRKEELHPTCHELEDVGWKTLLAAWDFRYLTDNREGIIS